MDEAVIALESFWHSGWNEARKPSKIVKKICCITSSLIAVYPTTLKCRK